MRPNLLSNADELDIYIAVVSSAHSVCPKGYYIAIVSTIAETSANHHLELAPGFERLGRIEEKFMVSPSSIINLSKH
jgi:Rab GDP dissociation inhibitor